MHSTSQKLSVESVFVNQSVEYLLNDYVPKIQRCLEQLTDEQIWWRPNASSNSIGNLLLHLCGNVRQWILCGLGDAPDQRARDLEFSQTEVIPRAALQQLLNDTLNDVKTVLENLPHEVLLETRQIQGKQVGVLEAIYHVTEHFSMHTGQIISFTKILKDADLNFYDFSDTAPRQRWKP